MASGPGTRRWQSEFLSGSFAACVLLLATARCTCEPVDLDSALFACTADSDCAGGFGCSSDGLCATGPQVMADGGPDGCVPSSASAVEEVCHGGVDEDCDGAADCEDPDCEALACSEDGAFACRAGGCECAVTDFELDPGPNAGDSVVPFNGGLAWLMGGDNGDIRYGECTGGCESPVTSVLEVPNYPKQRPALKRGGEGLIAGWRRGNREFAFAECASDCLDGGFSRVALAGLESGPMPVDVAATGTHRALIAMDQSKRVLWVECAGQCDDPAQWSSRVLSNAEPRGVAALMWEEDGEVRRMAAFGDPLRLRSCSGDCAAASAWTPTLTLDSDSLEPELHRTDAGHVAIFARSETLKKLFAYLCEAGKDCAAPQSWIPVLAGSFPGNTRRFNASVTPDGRFAFATSVPAGLLAGVQTQGGFATTTLPLCDGGIAEGWEPDGFVDSQGRWTLLYHSKDDRSRLYLPRP